MSFPDTVSKTTGVDPFELISESFKRHQKLVNIHEEIVIKLDDTASATIYFLYDYDKKTFVSSNVSFKITEQDELLVNIIKGKLAKKILNKKSLIIDKLTKIYSSYINETDPFTSMVATELNGKVSKYKCTCSKQLVYNQLKTGSIIASCTCGAEYKMVAFWRPILDKQTWSTTYFGMTSTDISIKQKQSSEAAIRASEARQQRMDAKNKADRLEYLERRNRELEESERNRAFTCSRCGGPSGGMGGPCECGSDDRNTGWGPFHY